MSSNGFYQDPALRVAMDLMRNGHPGVPSHDTVHRAVTGDVARQRAGRTRPAVTTSRQARQALAGHPVRPLPTRTARKVKAKKNKMIKRLGVATPVGMAVMIALLFVIPSVLAAVTLGLTATSLVLALSR